MLHRHNNKIGLKKSKFILLFLVNFLCHCLTFVGQYSFTMPALSNKQKTKCNNMAAACQSCHKSQAGSPLLIPDSGNIGSSAPESGLEFLGTHNLDNGDISSGLDLEIKEKDEQGYLREGEDLNDIYSDDKQEELDDDKLLRLLLEKGLKKREQQSQQPLIAYQSLLQPPSVEQWKKAEQRRGMGYSAPLAKRTVREHKQKAQEAEIIAKETRKG